MRITFRPGGAIHVEGNRRELLEARIIDLHDTLPYKPGGYVDRGAVRISMLRSGELRVRGRHAEACRADGQFQSFLCRLIERGSDAT